MLFVDKIEWNKCVESVSIVEQNHNDMRIHAQMINECSKQLIQLNDECIKAVAISSDVLDEAIMINYPSESERDKLLTRIDRIVTEQKETAATIIESIERLNSVVINK